jgi:hypothetical protein
LDKDFSRRLRLDFTRNYVFHKERLRYVLNKQIEVCSEEELMYKYRTIFPTQINTMDDILRLGRLKREEIHFEKMKPEMPCTIQYPKPKERKHLRKEGEPIYKILFIDASQYFSKDETVEIRAVEPPLGHMAILSYLYEKFGDRIQGRICKSGVDFDSMEELHAVLNEFKPDLIGMRTMTYFKKFFHDVVGEIRRFSASVPIVAGGPHPTIAPEEVLRENEIQAVSIGEGELTWEELVGRILENGHKFLGAEVLHSIKGIAFLEEV